MSRPIRVGITHGDSNGISYEIILKALADDRMCELCTPVVFGSAKLIGYYRKTLGIDDVNYNGITDLDYIRDGQPNIFNISQEEFKVDMGIPTAESGRAALMSIEAACEALRSGYIDVLVTAPISKEAIRLAGSPYPGHTEMLQDLLGEGSKATMILFDEDIKVALVTTHLPIREVANAITVENVAGAITSFSDSLKRDFRIERPKIAVLALNPHGGDNGVAGTEEIEVIIPAIAQCVENKILAFGPFPADGFFGTGSYRDFDGVLAMYHDQGLAPFKLMAGSEGVNFTAGLPFVRTSPDHGTGYDIVGRGKADETSMRQAIYAALDIFRARVDYDRATANPLRKQYQERGADKTIDLTKDEPEL